MTNPKSPTNHSTEPTSDHQSERGALGSATSAGASEPVREVVNLENVEVVAISGQTPMRRKIVSKKDKPLRLPKILVYSNAQGHRPHESPKSLSEPVEEETVDRPQKVTKNLSKSAEEQTAKRVVPVVPVVPVQQHNTEPARDNHGDSHCGGSCMEARVMDVAQQACSLNPPQKLGDYVVRFQNPLLCGHDVCDVLETIRVEPVLVHDGKVKRFKKRLPHGQSAPLPSLKTADGRVKKSHYADVIQAYPSLAKRAAAAIESVQQDADRRHQILKSAEAAARRAVLKILRAHIVSGAQWNPPTSQCSAVPGGAERVRYPPPHRLAIRAQQECSNCKTTTTPFWKIHHNGSTVCNACWLYWRRRNTERPQRLWPRPAKKN